MGSISSWLWSISSVVPLKLLFLKSKIKGDSWNWFGSIVLGGVFYD